MNRKLLLTVICMMAIQTIGCSYVMDSIEGSITKRSSFSVDVKRTGNTFTLDWSKDAPSITEESFAGYEIYITDEANNEFAGYELLYSGYTDNQGSAGHNTALANSTTKQTTFTYNPLTAAGSTYFFRVGVIYWDEDREADRVKKWKTPDYNYNWDRSNTTVTNWYYTRYTNIDKISGGTMVKF